MNTKQTSQMNWPAGMIIASSIPILATIINIILAWISEITTHNGIYDVTAEQAALFSGLYLALPCGLLNIIVASYARAKGLLKKKIAIPGIIIGVVGILLGLFAWALFYMISSFVF
jgi:hypothetical protein